MPRSDSSLHFFMRLSMREKTKKNPKKKFQKIQDPKILLFMPRGNSILILTAMLYTFFFICTESADFFLLF